MILWTKRYRNNSQEKTTRNKRKLVKFKESDNSQAFEANWKLYILGLGRRWSKNMNIINYYGL